jgi:hypothetical protein
LLLPYAEFHSPLSDVCIKAFGQSFHKL